MASERKLSEEEFETILKRIMAAADQPLPEMVFDPIELDFDIDGLFARSPEPPVKPPAADTLAASLSGTQPICIRIPARVVHAFKVQADKTGGSYQAIMNRALNTAAAGFV